MLIAGRNEVNFTPALDRAARAWNVNPRNVNEVCGKTPCLVPSLQ